MELGREGCMCTDWSVTGGHWESASTRCCLGRHHSMPSLLWRPTARSRNARCASIQYISCFCYSTSLEAGRLMGFAILNHSVVGSLSDSTDSCTLFSPDSPRHTGHMQGDLLYSLALVFAGYLRTCQQFYLHPVAI